jgi:hypothetical protein
MLAVSATKGPALFLSDSGSAVEDIKRSWPVFSPIALWELQPSFFPGAQCFRLRYVKYLTRCLPIIRPPICVK